MNKNLRKKYVSYIPWLILKQIRGIGIYKSAYISSIFNPINDFFALDEKALFNFGFNKSQIYQLKHPNWAEIDSQLELIEHYQLLLIHIQEDNYPQLLKNIPNPPCLIYCKGNYELLNQKCLSLAIVGSRKPSAEAINNCQELLAYLGQYNIKTISGLAYGIDKICHQLSLQYELPTIAVLANGLNSIYPTTHSDLAKKIIQNKGCLISELAVGKSISKYNFPQRNRIISGLAHGLIVIEAKNKSGSLITAKHAIEQNREIFAFPAKFNNPHSGTNLLIQQGAKLVNCLNDINTELQSIMPMHKKENLAIKHSLAEQKIISLLESTNRPLSIDDIVIQCSLDLSNASDILLKFEMNNICKLSFGGYIINK